MSRMSQHVESKGRNAYFWGWGSILTRVQINTQFLYDFAFLIIVNLYVRLCMDFFGEGDNIVIVFVNIGSNQYTVFVLSGMSWLYGRRGWVGGDNIFFTQSQIIAQFLYSACIIMANLQDWLCVWSYGKPRNHIIAELLYYSAFIIVMNLQDRLWMCFFFWGGGGGGGGG